MGQLEHDGNAEHIAIDILCGESIACYDDRGQPSPMEAHLGDALTSKATFLLDIVLVPGGGEARLAETALADGAPHVVGFADDAVGSAFKNMRGGGGHAMRYLIDAGIISNKGSVAAKATVFQQKLSPILTNPSMTFDWRIGSTPSKAFVGTVDGQTVVAFVAKEGPYQGNVLSAFVPTPENMVKWGIG